ncbi:hypothetical protein AV540_16305 [Brevibacillus parabrevis]|nr:hypothetical protein AV540_16305 [Brevibacillus parabrevis]
MIVVANDQHMSNRVILQNLLAIQQVFVCTGRFVFHENLPGRNAVGDQILAADLCFCSRLAFPKPASDQQSGNVPIFVQPDGLLQSFAQSGTGAFPPHSSAEDNSDIGMAGNRLCGYLFNPPPMIADPHPADQKKDSQRAQNSSRKKYLQSFC